MDDQYLQQKTLILQKWRDLFFVHWEVSPEQIQKTLPQGLLVDTFQGKAYLGLVPFRLFALRPSVLPSLPFISNFYEINLRTYVVDSKGEKGIWFYSLDANRWLAVKSARCLFHLPYLYSKISFWRSQQTVRFELIRRNFFEKASMVFSHEAESRRAAPDTLDHFLIERYLLFTTHQDALYSVAVSHKSYALSDASFQGENLFLLNPFTLKTKEPCHIVYSPGVDVLTYPLKPCC